MFDKKRKAAEKASAAKGRNKKKAADVKKTASRKQNKKPFIDNDFIEEMMMFEMFFDDD